MSTESETEFPAGFSADDIFFDCPRCGKSLGIDRRGAGLIVRCPACGLRMQVPMPETPEAVSEEASPPVLTATQTREIAPDVEVSRIAYDYEEAELCRRRMEKMRVDFLAKFERIREEIAVIQAGLDRMVDILQDVENNPSGRIE